MIVYVSGLLSRSMATKGLTKLFEPVVNWMAVRYQAAVAKELKKYGLRYEDLLDPELNMDVAEALSRLPQEEVDMRMQRLKRAVDCSLKKAYLPKDLQDKQTPYKWYLKDVVEQVEAEMAERALLGTGKPYERQIP